MITVSFRYSALLAEKTSSDQFKFQYNLVSDRKTVDTPVKPALNFPRHFILVNKSL